MCATATHATCCRHCCFLLIQHLLLTGHDTSAITLTNVLAKLQQHPQAMQQLRQEQQQVRSRHGEALSGAVLKDMVYAEAVIRWAWGGLGWLV